jgi:hypothetical protein
VGLGFLTEQGQVGGQRARRSRPCEQSFTVVRPSAQCWQDSMAGQGDMTHRISSASIFGGQLFQASVGAAQKWAGVLTQDTQQATWGNRWF